MARVTVRTARGRSQSSSAGLAPTTDAARDMRGMVMWFGELLSVACAGRATDREAIADPL
jgi:hypothetical protein